MAALFESIKATFAPAPEDGSTSNGQQPAPTPDLSSAPGGFKEDSEPVIGKSADHDSTTGESLLPEMKTAGLAGALNAPHLRDRRNDSLGALSTTAVKNEPTGDTETKVENIGGGEPGLSERFAGLQTDGETSNQDGESGLHSRVSSKFARDLSKYSNPDSTLAPHREGKAGAFNEEGRKVHESTDSEPGAFGVMGGSHLNSADNRPETAGISSEVPTFEPDQGAQMQGILAPGPAMAALPPTEPSSSSPTPALRDGDGLGAAELNKSPLSKEVNESTSSVHQTEPLSPATDATPAARIGSQDPSLVSHPQNTLLAMEKANAEELAASGEKNNKEKVKLGDKLKGFVTEMKGVVKKDPEIKEQGKAMRTGNI